jgi:putative GTP pyrophosphokinase
MQPSLERALDELVRYTNHELAGLDLRASVKARTKSFDSLYDKILRKLRVNHTEESCLRVTDLLGLRVVCPFLADIERADTRLRESFEVLETEQKGSRFNGAEFGYESTHYLVRVPPTIASSAGLPENARCEIQLRTNLQDAWAEVEHELVYKADFAPFDESIRRKLAAVNANLTLADIVFQEVRDYQRRVHAQISKRRMDFWGAIHQAAGLSAANGSENPETPDLIDPNNVGGLSDQMDRMLLAALQAHNRRDFRSAVELYTELLAAGPKDHVAAIVHTHRGMAYFAESDYGNAVTDFTRSLEIDEESWKARFYRGLVYHIAGDFENAMRDFDACISHDQYQFDTLHARAQLQFDLGSFEAAERDCRAALELHPDAEAVLELRRRCRFRMEYSARG